MSRRRPGQKGVEAIFTPPRRHGRRRILFGTIGILAGIALWTTALLSTRPIRVIWASEVVSYLPLVLTSLGILLATCGAGICIASWHGSGDETGAEAPLNLRLSLVVFLQSLLLVVLYDGLIQEYQSNLTMQQWVRSVFMFGDYLLNDWAVVLGSLLLGVLVVVSLTREEFGA